MKRLGSAALAAAVAGSTLFAAADGSQAITRDAYIQTYYLHHSRDAGYWQWRARHGGWDRRDYGRWYYGHRGDIAAAAFFGLAAGALVGGVVAASADPAEAHARACSQLYESYNRQTDTYLGYDWQRHPCTAF